MYPSRLRPNSPRYARCVVLMQVIAVMMVMVAVPVPANADAGTGGSDPEVSLERRLDELNSTLQRMATLLERQLEMQETDLFYRRLEVLETSLATDRQALHKAREQERQEASESESLELMLEQFEQQIATLEEDDEELPMMRMQFHQMEGRVEVIRDSLRELSVYISQLESRIQRREEDLLALQDELAQR
ncbi:MAG: hypothetical protein MPN21_27235 [Thermoanaerobaculia bacterium]|nr:hypothetical protein [Thermoanaerobaculia bacterium]